MHVFEIMPIHNLIKIQNNQLSALYTCVLFFFWSYLGAYILEYLYRESSDIEGPEIDGHVTHGAILFHKSWVEFACASKPHWATCRRDWVWDGVTLN